MKNWLLAGGVAAAIMAAGGAHAASPTLIGKFSDWVASTYGDNGKTLCYATTEPTREAGSPKGRGKPYVAVTHVADSNLHDQVSYIAGYELKPGSTVRFTIGKQTFALDLLQKGRAWAKDSDVDSQIVAAMKRGNALTVRGTSAHGGEVTDSYSLIGFTKAYEAIGAACKVK